MTSLRILGAVVSSVLALAVAGPTDAADPMTVGEFSRIARAAPRTPAAMLRSDVRRAMTAWRAAMEAVRREEAAARRAGATPPFCIPRNPGLTPQVIIDHMDAVPAARQGAPLAAEVRAWMSVRHPCV